MDKLEKSTHYFVEAWDFFCSRLPRGEVRSLPGVVAAFGHIPVPFFNLCFLDSPVRSKEDLRARVRVANEFGAAGEVPWMLGLCEEWLPEDPDEVCGDAGLTPAMKLTAMVASQLSEPRRPLPDLRYEEARSQEGYDLMAEINGLAYGMPKEMIAPLTVASLWDGPIYPVIGFCGSDPVTCSATLLVDGIRYVAWVATLPEHQRRGYAEAAMRESLKIAFEKTGVSETWLHATEAGQPMYQAMGYEVTASFSLYAPAIEE